MSDGLLIRCFARGTGYFAAKRPAANFTLRHRLILTLFIILTSLLVAPVSAASAATNTIIDLGTLGGSTSAATGVNDSGQVVGTSTLIGDASGHAFSWTQADGMIDLGTLGNTDSAARGVNNSGQVVGFSDIPGGRHAFSWTQAEGMVDLGTLGGNFSEALFVNDSGQVVGVSTKANGAEGTYAFSWTQAGGMVDLGTLGGDWSWPLALNDSGQIVGYSNVAGDQAQHAFYWTQSGGIVDLGTLAGGTSYAWGVNDSGQVVGGSFIDEENGVGSAFSWTQTGGMVDLGTLGGSISYAFGVNNSGQVVGGSGVTGGTDQHAFSWTQTGGMIDLGTLGGEWSRATLVNDLGQVVGTSNFEGDYEHTHAFAWTQAGGMIDLGTLGGGWSEASGINDSGQVVGWADHAGDNARHAFLYSLDTTPPTTTLSTSPATPNGLDSWFTSRPDITLSSDESGVTQYQWDGTGDSSWSTATGAFVYDASQGLRTLYYRSIDTAGNTEDANSQVFKLDTVAPTAPALSGSLSGASAADLSWTAASDATSGVSDYKLYNADTDALLETTASTSTSRTDLSASTTYRYYVKSYDAAGNPSAESNIVSVTTATPTTTTTLPPTTTTTLPVPDTTPPATPTLSARQTAAGEIALNWSPSTDAGGLAGYKLYNSSGGALLESFGSSTRSKVYTGLTPGTRYSYYVKSYDTSSNYSAASNTVNITVSAEEDRGVTLPGTPGEPVTVSPVPEVSLNFSAVTSGGTTTVTTSSTPPHGGPTGFSVLGTYFQIETTATFSGPITLCINYPEPTGGGQENNLRLMHYPDTGPPEDITTSIDIENNVICGETPGFSHFGVGFPRLADTGGSGLGLFAAIGLALLGGSVLGYRMRRLGSAA